MVRESEAVIAPGGYGKTEMIKNLTTERDVVIT